MKIVKIILGVLIFLVILVILFFGRGYLTPTVFYESEITVDKPVAEAWAVMNDESKITEWLSGITKVEHVSGEKGKVGQVTKYTFNENGQESEVVETLKKIVPNQKVEMDFVIEGAMKMEYEVNFSEKDGKTYVKSKTLNTGEGLIMRSMLSFMQGGMKSQEDENMGRLKKLIKENKTNYFPEPILEPALEMGEQ